MIEKRRSAARVLVATVVAVAAVTPPSWGGQKRFPYRLGLDVVLVAPGSEIWREELERALSRSLQAAGCFLDVRRAPREAGEDVPALLLRVGVERLIDEVSFDLSIAERYSRHAPPDARRQLTSWVEADLQLELRVLPEQASVRARHLHVRTGYRPRLNEDPRLESRSQAIEEIVRLTQAWACKGSEKKLGKEIQRARTAAASVDAAPAR